MKKVQERLNLRREQIENNQLEISENKYVTSLYNNCKELALNSSQLGDDRPLSCVRYAPSGMHVATGSLSCYIKLWDVVDLSCVDTLRGHEERITSLSWNPGSQGLSQGKKKFLQQTLSLIFIFHLGLLPFIFLSAFYHCNSQTFIPPMNLLHALFTTQCELHSTESTLRLEIIIAEITFGLLLS